MMGSRLKEGWKIRNMNYANIHNISEQDMQKLVKSIEIKNKDIIVDLMCGYGDVSKHILDYSKNKKLKVNLYLIDKFKEQFQRTIRKGG